MVSLTFWPLSTFTLSGAGVTFEPSSSTSISLTSLLAVALGDDDAVVVAEDVDVGSTTTGESAPSPPDDPHAPRANTASTAAAGRTSERRVMRGTRTPVGWCGRSGVRLRRGGAAV